MAEEAAAAKKAMEVAAKNMPHSNPRASMHMRRRFGAMPQAAQKKKEEEAAKKKQREEEEVKMAEQKVRRNRELAAVR